MLEGSYRDVGEGRGNVVVLEESSMYGSDGQAKLWALVRISVISGGLSRSSVPSRDLLVYFCLLNRSNKIPIH